MKEELNLWKSAVIIEEAYSQFINTNFSNKEFWEPFKNTISKLPILSQLDDIDLKNKLINDKFEEFKIERIKELRLHMLKFLIDSIIPEVEYDGRDNAYRQSKFDMNLEIIKMIFEKYHNVRIEIGD